MQAIFTTEEILAQLDECARGCIFPMLDNGYIYPADVRLSAYADEQRWALVIETIGYNFRAGDHYGLQNCLSLYGNCLKRAPGFANEDFFSFTDDGDEGAIFDDEYGWFVDRETGTIRIREQIIPYDLSPDAVQQKNIVPVEPDHLTAVELLRSLLPEHRSLLLLTEEELQQRIPPDLPRLLQLDEWHHPDLVNEEWPSQTEAFSMIAEVLVHNDPSLYRPTLPPNTHWSNWPEGGTL